MVKEGEGLIRTEDDRLKAHMHEHIDNEDWALLIELAWILLKRRGVKCLTLK